MRIKAKHYVLVIFLVLLLLVGGIGKVSYGFYQMVGVERAPTIEVRLVEGNIELDLFNQKRAINLIYFAEVSRERLQNILPWQE